MYPSAPWIGLNDVLPLVILLEPSLPVWVRRHEEKLASEGCPSLPYVQFSVDSLVDMRDKSQVHLKPFSYET
jgi:hypothetical protein